MNTVGIGLIGCGARLREVIKNTLAASDKVKVVAAYDPDQRSIDATRDQFNRDLNIYDSYQELVQAPEVEWVMVGSWNCFHRDHVIAAFEAGKHVFSEKPLATTLEDCVAMREAWQKTDKKFVIGFTLRYSAHYEKIREIIESGELGFIVSMEFNETLDFNHGGFIHGDWRRLTENAGTHLLEKCSHDIDLVNWMVDSRASRVSSFGGINFFKPENEYHVERVGKSDDGNEAFQVWDGAVRENPFTSNKDIIDNQVAIIEYENGVRTTFHTNCNSAIPERRMYICGSEGCLRSDVIAGEIEIKKIGFNEELKEIDVNVSGGHGGGDSVLGVKLAACMLDGADPVSTLEDGFMSAITCFGIDEAMETGQVVDMKKWWDRAGM